VSIFIKLKLKKENRLLEKSLLQKVNNSIITIIVLQIFFVITLVIPGYSTGIGGYGGAYLREPVGATGYALGGAQTASPEYLYGWWNPASIITEKNKIFVCNLGYRPLGKTAGCIAYSIPVPPRVGFEISMLYRGIPVIKGLVDEQEYPIENCSFSTYSIRASIGYHIKRKLSIGINTSFYIQQLPVTYNETGGVSNSSSTSIGLDLGLKYIVNKNLCYGLVIKNLLSNFKWEFGDFSPMYEDTLPVTVTLGQQLRTYLLGKPFIWSCDCIFYLFNSGFKPLENSHLLINNGVEWQRWNILSLRLGVSEIDINRDMIRNTHQFRDYFSALLTFGVGLDLSSVMKNKKTRFNYAIGAEKNGAGIVQQLDFVMKF